MVPIGTGTPTDATSSQTPDSSDTTTPAASDGAPQVPPEKGSECTGARFDNLYLILTNPSCQVDTRGDKPVDVKADLDVSVAAKTPEIVPGGRVDIVVSYKNKGQKPLQLHFVLDPSPRFDVDAFDTKGRPAGVPKGRVPKAPKPSQKTTARITLLPGGVAKMKIAGTRRTRGGRPSK